MSLRKQALSGVFWTSIQQFSTQGISFVVSIILARLLLPSEFGLIALIGVFIGIGSALVGSGLSQSLIRTTDPDDEDFSTVFFFNLGGSIVIYLIIFFSAPLIALFYKEAILTLLIRVYSVIFIINAFSTIQNTILLKNLDFKRQLIVSIPSLIIGSVIGITLAYNGFGVWSLVWNSIVQSSLMAIQLWYWSKWKPKWVFSKEKFKYHFGYGFKLTISSIIDTFFNNAYTIIIGKFFTTAQVGFYNRADSLKQLPVTNITQIINKVTFPLFASIKDDDVRLKEINKKIMKMVIFIVAPTLALMLVLAEPLISLLLGEKWMPAVPYFKILCLNGLLFPIHSYNLNILKVKGRSDLFLKLEIVKKIIIIVVIACTFQLGIDGLLYGSVLLSLISFFINSYYTGKFINYNTIEQIKDIIPAVIIAFFMGLIVHFADKGLKYQMGYDIDIVRLLVGSVIGSLLYLTFSYMIKLSSISELLMILHKKRNLKS
ncbi:lipopolysaccharide biosynthesis protein [Aquimarina longa]|uniref:lipopolysaccharide biosynthesis protein n=1 Tax=Aquimarina longa TaxID=1080221 RepID=UPI000782972D|nr:lipopolysaccharide biosynthesis protein [Aquimarina longa]